MSHQGTPVWAGSGPSHQSAQAVLGPSHKAVWSQGGSGPSHQSPGGQSSPGGPSQYGEPWSWEGSGPSHQSSPAGQPTGGSRTGPSHHREPQARWGGRLGPSPCSVPLQPPGPAASGPSPMTGGQEVDRRSELRKKEVPRSTCCAFILVLSPLRSSPSAF